MPNPKNFVESGVLTTYPSGITDEEDEKYPLFEIAQSHFVAARVALLGDLAWSAPLLMEQCIELALKAIVKSAEPKAKFANSDGHKIGKILERATETRPLLKALSADPNLAKLITALETGYNPIRYGEVRFGMIFPDLVHVFDRAAWIVLSEANVALRYRDFLVSVADSIMPLFTRDLRIPVEATIPQDSLYPHTEVVFRRFGEADA